MTISQAVYEAQIARIADLQARLAEATELVRDALRYPHKPGSKHSTWDERAFAFLRTADIAFVCPSCGAIEDDHAVVHKEGCRYFRSDGGCLGAATTVAASQEKP